MWIEDLERGVMPKINPDPWQTDTSIGDWYYNKNWKFRPVSWSIHMLVDIVAKNGNLLLNVVQRPDGSLDPEVEEALREMAKWNAIHGEAIFGTRPWEVYGEGAIKAKGGHFNENYAYTSKDIRFTTKGKTLYAISLGWPQDGRLVVRSLAKPDGENINNIKTVSLVGYSGNVSWTQSTNGLEVTLPEQKISEYTAALKITGADLKPAPLPEPAAAAIQPDANGNYRLGADDAEMHGDQVKTEDHGGQSNVGFWDKPQDWISWKVNFKKAGPFKVSASVASLHPTALYVVDVAGSQLETRPAVTAAWDKFQVQNIGTIDIKQPGEQLLKIRAKDAQTWKAINLRFLKLTKAE
jgi:alpha-L-fucosidase